MINMSEQHYESLHGLISMTRSDIDNYREYANGPVESALVEQAARCSIDYMLKLLDMLEFSCSNRGEVTKRMVADVAEHFGYDPEDIFEDIGEQLTYSRDDVVTSLERATGASEEHLNEVIEMHLKAIIESAQGLEHNPDEWS